MRTIKDPLIEPYFIIVDEHSYTIAKTMIPKVKYTETGGKPYLKYLGCYTMLRYLFKKLIKLKPKNKELINEFVYLLKREREIEGNLVTIMRKMPV
jgi:hypothetical protein